MLKKICVIFVMSLSVSLFASAKTINAVNGSCQTKAISSGTSMTLCLSEKSEHNKILDPGIVANQGCTQTETDRYIISRCVFSTDNPNSQGQLIKTSLNSISNGNTLDFACYDDCLSTGGSEMTCLDRCNGGLFSDDEGLISF